VASAIEKPTKEEGEKNYEKNQKYTRQKCTTSKSEEVNR